MNYIAFLGMGVMGSAMAANIAKAGYAVTVWNRTPDRPAIQCATHAGALWKDTIGAAVENAPLIFLCLGDVPDVEEVLFAPAGVASVAQPGSLVIDTSTIGPLAAQQIAEKLAQHQLRFMDAPVSGGDIGAQQGTLTFMVGGSKGDYESSLPILRTMGKHIFHCGEIGAGQSVKLCNQILVSNYMVGICEALLLAERMHLDPQLIVDICGSGAAASWALSNLGLKVAYRDFAPGFMIKHMVKDLKLVATAAHELALPGTTLATHLFEQVSQLPEGNSQGTQAMIRAYQGVE